MALRYWMGFAVIFGAIAMLSPSVYTRIAANDPQMTGALLGGLMAATATALGTIPALLTRQITQRVNDTMMGFGAGVMLAATSFSLIIPGLNIASNQGAGPWLASSIIGGGIVLGALALMFIDRLIPHEHFVKGVEGGPINRADAVQATKLKRVWLFVMAIALHNFPEGLAIGVAFAGPDDVGAKALALGISIQDIPEGLVVALALLGVGYSKGLAATVAILTGLVEPIAAVLGVALVSMSSLFL